MQRAGIVLILALMGGGCTDQELDAGAEGAACLPDNSCADSLRCLSSRCVRLPQPDSGLSIDGEIPAVDIAAMPDIQADAAPLPPLEWTACDTTIWPAGYSKPSFAVKCTQVEVPLDYKNPTGEKITLRVGRHNSKAFPTGKAVFNLAGGPGGAAVTQSGSMHMHLAQIRDSFDLVYVDQRGTGASNPLPCSGGYPSNKLQWINCADDHLDKDLNLYLTVNAARDLELVRQRLGYDRIYLRGGSYGTRLGLEYIRQYENNVAAAVLDGLAPPDWDIFTHTTVGLEQAVIKLIADCEADPACLAVAPDLGADLELRRQTLKTSPRAIKIQGTTYVEDETLFMDSLYGLIDRAFWYYRLPRAIHQAVNGDNALWNQLLSEIYGVPVTDGAVDPLEPPAAPHFPARPTRRPFHLVDVDYVSPGLFITIECAEWWPQNTGLLSLEQLAAEQTWLVSGRLDVASACSSWPVDPVAPALRQPVVSSVKTLLLSGEIDIRTPPSTGEQTLKTLDQGTHLVIPYASHSTVSVPCAGEIIAQFLKADGDISKVDSSCMAKMSHPAW